MKATPAATPAADGTHSKALPAEEPRPSRERRPSLSLQGLESSTLTTGKSSGRIYGSRSLFLFPVRHPLRRFAIQAIEWKWFDRIVLLLIVTNCVFLAITDPTCVLTPPPIPSVRSSSRTSGHYVCSAGVRMDAATATRRLTPSSCTPSMSFASCSPSR